MDIDLNALRRKIERRYVAATFIAVVPISLYFVLAAKYFHFKRSYTSPTVLVLPFLLYLPFAVTNWHAKKLFRPIAAWAATDREPTPHERELVIGHPRRIAMDAFGHWMWGLAVAIFSGVVNFEGLGFQFVPITVAILMSTMIGCSLVYLFTEDAMRPLYIRVLDGHVSRPATVGVRVRLILIWIVGAATYFVAVALILNGSPPGTAAPYIYGACGFALVVGIVITLVGARSVARPLDVVSEALARVERGDLDTSVPVDDAGEVGRLQSGFNRMVAGLRERDRLERLFARHVGPDVARRAVTSTGLAGVEVEATVMFVDILGSTALAAERPPESVVAMINALFGCVVRVVGDEGGLVNQFQGDGALCIFGAPLELPDHAARALRAAIALRREIVALGDVYPGFDAAIGVSTGRVVAGDVGTEDCSEYTVIGDAANEASRLTDQAKERASRVLVSEQTVRSGDGAGQWLSAGLLELRGRRTPTGVFEPAEAPSSSPSRTDEA
jgi:adenylate cyclase